jgi:O-acetyl-ADP-ribose deacetylase (regulator of RNase III)
MDRCAAKMSAIVRVIENGDLFGSPAQTLVNPVNCVGVMGKGLALAFKARYPGMFADYRSLCTEGGLQLGAPRLWPGRPRQVVLFPTKDHWRERSPLSAVEQGLDVLVASLAEWDISSLAVPALGCGEGGLAWEPVRDLLVSRLGGTVPTWIFAPR